MARKKVRKDEVFGELTQDVGDLWEQPIELPFLGAVRKATLSVLISEQSGVKPQQVKAYRDFMKRTDQYMAKAEKAIFKFCRSEEAETQYDNVPRVKSVGELAKLVTLEGVYFDYTSDEPTVGVLCQCTWDEEHGLGVLFKKGKVTEVGPQDVVL